jgi:hypothetical protein
LCGWFRRLENCCFVANVLGVALVEVAMCWAPSLSELFGCWLWDMLFVTMVEGRLWIVGRDNFGSCWRHSCKVGNMTKGICGSLVDTMNTDGSDGTKGGMMKMNVMVVASEMCG